MNISYLHLKSDQGIVVEYSHHICACMKTERCKQYSCTCLREL